MANFTIKNYIHIPGHAILELKLSGTELLVYSIIHGFTQDGENFFEGGLSYLQSATNASKATIIRSLKSLVEANFLIRDEKKVNNVLFVRYKTCGIKMTPPVSNDSERVVSKCNQGGVKMIPNNTIYNINNNNMSEIKISDDPALFDLDVSLYQDQRNILITKSFFDLFRKNQIEQGVTTFKKYDSTKLKTWLIHVDRMLNIDGITPDTLLAIYKWLLTDKFRNAEFWRKNILSTAKLREQMPKLQLAMFDDMKTLEKEIEKTKANQRDQSRLGI